MRRNMEHQHIFEPRTVEEVFSDFNGRRLGLIKALTSDFDKFFQQCHPDKENLCLFGFPNESWEVSLPPEDVPPELPEPALGINFARDGMLKIDWLGMVAVHSDSWLLAVAFFYGARLGFGANERNRLFQMINKLPTLFDVVKENVKQPNDQSGGQNNDKGESSSKTSRQSETQQSKRAKVSFTPVDLEDIGEEEDDDDDEQGSLCGVCGDRYGEDEFWICCDICEQWFHGECVKITPAKAKHIKHYKCPGCSNNKRHRD